MNELGAPIADRGSALAGAATLGPTLDEIRWMHPELRVVCGAFVGSALRVLAESRPATMPSLVEVQATGRQSAALAEVLEDGDELVVPDVREHPSLTKVSTEMLGRGTVATAIVPLRIDDHLVGFLRLDSPRAGAITQHAVERLHEAAPLASLAIALEHERMLSRAHISRVQQLRASICRQTAEQREAGSELRQAIGSLHAMVQRVAPELEPATRIEFGTIVHRIATQVDAVDPPNETVPSAANGIASNS